MLSCNLVIDCPSRYKVDRESIRRSLVRTLEGQKVSEEVEIEVSIVGERKMAQLHEKYLETHEATDVISFSLDHDEQFPDGVVRLGCIVVCYPVAVRGAAEFGRRIADEVDRLVEHGCLHLLGVHHR